MAPSTQVDAIVVGSGPNGLAAAITLARAGKSVRVFEAADTIGGGMRSDELTKPGFIHDVCSTVQAMMLASPFLRSLPLSNYGLELVHPGAPFAHPLDDGDAVVVHRSIDETVAALTRHDGRAYRSLIAPFVDRTDELNEALLAPFGIRKPFLMARFGIHAIRSASALARSHFKDERTRAMFAGVAAHSMVPLDYMSTAGYGLALIIAAHAGGWPIVRGGSQRLADAMAAHLRSLGGEIVTGMRVDSLDALPPSRVVLCDVTPRQLIQMAGDKMPGHYRGRLSRYRYGPGVFKIDWALSEPVPWRSAACRSAGTLHLGGTFAEIAESEYDAWNGRIAQRPYTLIVQPTLWDATRAPSGKHTLWGYCHVPHGSTEDMTKRIEDQIERFAPGFRECIEGRNVMFPADMERRNANYIGGDIAGGAADFGQFFARPIASLDPYKTAIDGVYLCSSSTPPGVGVHGMCGFHAANSALRAKF